MGGKGPETPEFDVGKVSAELLRSLSLGKRDDDEAERHLAYDYTERLTFFVLSVEAVFCGYALQLGSAIKEPGVHLAVLFALGGLAFVSGLLWRLFYNDRFHRLTHALALSRAI